MRRLPYWPLLALLLLVVGCAARRPEVREPLVVPQGRAPLVLVPGITGSMLRDTSTGRTVWGDTRSFFRPRDGGYALALPIGAGESSDLEAYAAILEVRLGLARYDIYGGLVRNLVAHGYRLGDLERPTAEDTLFVFPYDWRQGAADSAGALARWLEELRRVRGEDRLQVDFIAQSNAARIVRWYLRYGASSLEQVESGAAAAPDRVIAGKVILVGTANGGAMRTLRDLQRGRRYAPLFGRRFRPEMVSTFPSIYEALPGYLEQPFVDGEGNLLDLDLHDAQNWEHYGWGFYRPEAQRRIEKAGRDDLFGDADQRRAFLTEALDRARRLHRALRADGHLRPGTRYYMIQNVYRPTPERACLVPSGDGWTTRIRADEEPPTRYGDVLAVAPGDGHATQGSQMFLGPDEEAVLERPTHQVDAPHRKLLASRATWRFLLQVLAE